MFSNILIFPLKGNMPFASPSKSQGFKRQEMLDWKMLLGIPHSTLGEVGGSREALFKQWTLDWESYSEAEWGV